MPALAIASALEGSGFGVHWIGTRRGLESELVPKRGYPLTAFDLTGFRGRSGRLRARALAEFARAFVTCLRLLPRLDVVAVLGMGGYASLPAGCAAWIVRRPLVIHEQNAVPGWANRLLYPLARRVLAGFPGAFPDSARVRVVGLPVAPAIAALPPPDERWRDRTGPARLLVLGGSQGAHRLNRLMPEILAGWPVDLPVMIRHQAGREEWEATRRAYAPDRGQVEVVPFFEDMAAAYGWADCVLARAGAATVAELACAGLPALLVPYPHAVDDHQTRNAEGLVGVGAACLVAERNLDPGAVRELMVGLLRDRARLLAMAEAARRLARPGAADAVAAEIRSAARRSA
jgi:UDP-N-acetylglucosamine--N-acetylmuramyl-(pentapeptide) pyrophosphoryl-undecaprenol N-acetylglucosamine transferase